MYTKEEFVSVFMEMIDQYGRIVEKDSVVRAVNCSKKENFEAILKNGKGILILPENSKFLIFHEMKDDLNIIPSKDFVLKINNVEKNITLNVVVPIEMQDFADVSKDCYEEIPRINFWKHFERLKNEGKEITGFAKHLIAGDPCESLVIATIAP